jgi:class 3 adenylate cyclase/ABC-type nitrate/sulfonate/bicarbonate transport system substrate-binding protein
MSARTVHATGAKMAIVYVEASLEVERALFRRHRHARAARPGAVLDAPVRSPGNWRRARRMRAIRRALGAMVLSALVVSLLAQPGRAEDKVSLQLKWLHQFQFAGYYAALEQGFYRDAGLDVEIREGGPDINATREVEVGKAEFGVCSTDVLIRRADQSPFVVLGVIFQHSPAVILALSRSHIGTVSELRGRRLMDAPGSYDLAAMLKYAGVDYAALPRVEHHGDPRELVAGKADAMVAYTTNEPFVLDQMRVPYQTFSPRAYGFDFYGDNLCTSTHQVAAYPKRTRAFLEASLKGWAYALAHKEETVELIFRRYSQKKSRDALMFEAKHTEALIEPDLIELGSQRRERWQDIADTYRDLGILRDARLPDGLVYQGDADRGWATARTAVIGLGLLALVSLVVAMTYKWIVRRLERTVTKPKFSTIMSGLFILLSIPALIFILIYNQRSNSQNMVAILQENVDRTRALSIENVNGMFERVAGSLRLLADIAAANPDLFRTEPSREFLHQVVASAPEIDGAYVSFEDGYHRVVTRIDDDRRRSDSRIPANANWHSSYIDDFSAGDKRARHRTFFDTWGHVVGGYDTLSKLDIRTLAGYAMAKESGAVVVTEPTVNPDTGYPIISVRTPIVRDGRFLGCASANVTLDVLSRYLTARRSSRHSTTVIADPTDGSIIATIDKEKSVRMVDGRLEVARLNNIADENVREAYRRHIQTGRDNFTFRSPGDGAELVASFTRFPQSFGHPWEAIIITPTDDFVGALRATNRQIIVVVLVLTAIELFLIYFLSQRLSRPIESVSQELKSVESLSFDQQSHGRSSVKEIAQLQSAAALLRNSLLSFSSFAPVDVVKGLIKSGIPLALGVEPRNLTIMFTDLEDFSTQAERLTPENLLNQMSLYFEEVSQAISQERGTVDKFIGDGIMSFWGAPITLPDHAVRACAGALRAARRMEQLNVKWRAAGKPTFRLRIGLNSAEVLVGNVGSSERFSYTVMGDGVNVAARLEGMNKVFGSSICISDSVFNAARSEILARPLRKVQVKGRKTEFMCYELLGMTNTGDPELAVREDDATLSEMTWVASSHLEKGNTAEAARCYHAILDRFPADPVAKSILKSLRTLARETQ